MKKLVLVVGLGAFLLPLQAFAGYQTCGSTVVADTVKRCADGSMPLFHAGTIQPYTAVAPQPHRPGESHCQPTAAPPVQYRGTARTNANASKMVLDVTRSGGQVSAYAVFSQGLVGEGKLEGTEAGGTLTLAGVLRHVGSQWQIRLTG